MRFGEALGYPFGELALWLALTSITYTLTLRFVFPGYFDPLWPWHSDHYSASALANTPTPWSFPVGWPRPVGFLYLKLSGLLGTRGSIGCTIAVMIANCALTILTFRRMIRLPLTFGFVISAVGYAFLIFSHPQQYGWATEDTSTQMAYLFLITTLWLSVRGAPLPAVVLSCAMGILAKETYALTAPAFAVLWVGVSAREDRGIPLRFGLALAISGIAAGLYNFTFKSVFLGAQQGSDSPYAPDFSPLSLLTEWARYAFAMGAATLVYLVILALIAARLPRNISPRLRWLGLGFAAAGALAWAPNSALPHHYAAGYVWNGAYLLSTPALMLAPLWKEGKRAVFSAALCASLLAPIVGEHAFRFGSWTVIQQTRQRNMLKAIRKQIETLRPDIKAVLVTGLDGPFSPFELPASLLKYGLPLPQFLVVDYSGSKITKVTNGGTVRWISPSEGLTAKRDAIWAFDEDGRWVDVDAPERSAKLTGIAGLDAATLNLYPAALVALEGDSRSSPDDDLAAGLAYLKCGEALLRDNRPDLALRCLTLSAERSPMNPYAHFTVGSAYEAEGDLVQAAREFELAIALSDPGKSDPRFAVALKRVQATRPASSSSAPL